MGILAGILKGAANRSIQLSDAERKAEARRKELADQRTFATTERIAGQTFQKEMKDKEIELAETKLKETRAYEEAQEKKRQDKIDERARENRKSAEKINYMSDRYFSPITQGLGLGKYGLGFDMPKKRSLEDRMLYLSKVTSDPEIYKKIQDSEPNKRAYFNELKVVRGLLNDSYIQKIKDQGVNVPPGKQIDIQKGNILNTGLFRLLKGNPVLKKDMFDIQSVGVKETLQKEEKSGSITIPGSNVINPVKIPKNKNNIIKNALRNLTTVNPQFEDQNAAYAHLTANGIPYNPNVPPTQGNNTFYHGLLRVDPVTKKPLSLFSTISQPNNDAPLPSNVQASLAQMRRYGWIGPKGEVTQENFALFNKYLSVAFNNTNNANQQMLALSLVSNENFVPITIGGTGKNQTAQQKEDVKYLQGMRVQETQINGALTNITTLEGLVKNFNIGGTFDQFVRALPSKISSAAKTISNLINPDSGEATIENFDFGEGVLRSALNDKSVRFVGGAKDYIQKKLDKLTDEISKNDQQAINTARIEVLQTALSYQLASVLQGGQDARTISDKDVALVSRMFNSALDSPVVLKNRIAQIKKYVLQKALTISLYSGLRGETPLGRLHAARKMEKILDQRRNAFSPYAEQGSGTDGLEDDIVRRANAAAMKSGAKISSNNTISKPRKVELLINKYKNVNKPALPNAINGFVQQTKGKVFEADDVAGGQSMLFDKRITTRINNYIKKELNNPLTSESTKIKTIKKYLQQGLKVPIDTIPDLKSRVEDGVGKTEEPLIQEGLLLTGINAGRKVPMYYYLVQEINEQGEPFITAGASPIKEETLNVKPRGERLRTLGGGLKRSLLKSFGSEEKVQRATEKLFGERPKEGFEEAGPF